MLSPTETSLTPIPLGNWVKFSVPCILIARSFRMYEYMPLVLPSLAIAGVGPRLPDKYSRRNFSWRTVALVATRERKSERVVKEGPEAASERLTPLNKSRITGVVDAAIACIWSALSMTVVLSKVCSMVLNNFPEKVVCAAAVTKELKPETTSSSRIILRPSKKSPRRTRRSRAEHSSQPSIFGIEVSIPWHKRYKYEAMSIDKTSNEVTVARAEINANELAPSRQSKNLILKATHELHGLIMHLSRLDVSGDGCCKIAKFCYVRGRSNIYALPMVIQRWVRCSKGRW